MNLKFVLKPFVVLLVVSFTTLLYSAHLANSVFASEADGAIDSTNRYAWSENVGWIDFGSDKGDVRITDSEIKGYAWGENIGWISLNCDNDESCRTVNYKVSNDGDGNLSGYAWGENVGWINFKPDYGGVRINDDGEFSGYAWGESVGWIAFNCETSNSCRNVDYKVSTEWRPESIRLSNTSLDTTAPSFILEKIGNLNYDTGVYVYYYTVSTPVFSGSGEESAVVRLTIDENDHDYQSVVDANNKWSIQSPNLNTARHQIQITAEDAAGNQTVLSFELVIDPSMQTFPKQIIDMMQGIYPTSEPNQPPLKEDLSKGMSGNGDTPGVQGNTLNIRLLDKKTGDPLSGVALTLYSEPQTSVTDENGEAVFENVAPGEHTLAFKYMGQKVEKALNLLNDEQHYKIDIRVELDTGGFFGMPDWGWGLIGISLAVVLFLTAKFVGVKNKMNGIV